MRKKETAPRREQLEHPRRSVRKETGEQLLQRVIRETIFYCIYGIDVNPRKYPRVQSDEDSAQEKNSQIPHNVAGSLNDILTRERRNSTRVLQERRKEKVRKLRRKNGAQERT